MKQKSLFVLLLAVGLTTTIPVVGHSQIFSDKEQASINSGLSNIQKLLVSPNLDLQQKALIKILEFINIVSARTDGTPQATIKFLADAKTIDLRNLNENKVSKLIVNALVSGKENVEAVLEANQFYLKYGHKPEPTSDSELPVFRKFIQAAQIPEIRVFLLDPLALAYKDKYKILGMADAYSEFCERTGRVPSRRTASRDSTEYKIAKAAFQYKGNPDFDEGLSIFGENFLYSQNISATMSAEKINRDYRATGEIPARASIFIKSVKRYHENKPAFWAQLDSDVAEKYKEKMEAGIASGKARHDFMTAAQLNALVADKKGRFRRAGKLFYQVMFYKDRAAFRNKLSPAALRLVEKLDLETCDQTFKEISPRFSEEPRTPVSQ